MLLAAGLLGGVAVTPLLRTATPAGLLGDLVRARPVRPFAPRLSIDTRYHRCTPVPVPGDGTVPREACANENAPLRLPALAVAGKSSDPASLEASALADVIWGGQTERSLDAAIARLLKALRLTPRPVPLLVDLSGTYLVRAQRTQNPRDLVEGLGYAFQALAKEPRNQAALFNAALALEWLSIDGEAAKAWDAYLAVDSRSAWAKEARQRKHALPRPRPPLREPLPGATASEVEAFAARHPQEARLLGWDRVLGAWGSAVLASNPARADAFLTLAERLGKALERRRGDASLADATRDIRAAATDSAATLTLARSYRAYAAGQSLYGAANHGAAQDSFTQIVHSRPPSPVLLEWAEAFLGGTLVYHRKYAEADSIFLPLLSRVDSLRHPALTARVRWMRGTRLLRTGQYPEARSHYTSAAKAFARLGETEYLGAVLVLGGETAYQQGDTLAAYQSLHRALLKLQPYRGSVWLHTLLVDLEHFATFDGMTEAAAPIVNEDVTVSLRGDTPATVEALLSRARIRAKTGHVDGATRDLDAVVPLIETLEAGRTRDWFATVLAVTRAMVRPDSGAALDSAVVFFKDNVVRLLPILTQRADARIARGNIAGATADLATVTSRIREISGGEADASLRAAMIEDARKSFDQLVMLHVRSGRTVDALEALERGRISLASAPGARVAPARVRPVAPRGQIAVDYALIGDMLLIWTIRDATVSLTHRTVDRGEFLRTVERVGVALETSAPLDRARPDLQRLYDWLVRPVRDRLGPDTSLVILADGEVAAVPFAALFDADHRRFLIEDYSLRFASSLADANHAPAAHARRGPALLVADPAFDPHQYPTLDPLRGARAEVHALGTLYPDPVLLVGRDATVEALTRLAQRASVIHYAGHAMFDDARPERSFLVLAGDSASGQLTTKEVSALRLRGVRLVVLSACRTLHSREGRSGGFAGLSGAFLNAGAGGVVGSLWNVDDGLARPLMLAFHRKLIDSGDTVGPAEALRQAQLGLLKDPNPALRSPAAWAGFRYAGN